MARRAARLDGLGTTIFTEMTALAQRTGAINLGQGFPDTDGPDEAIEAAVASVRAVKQYLTFAGGTPLQHAAAAALRLPPIHLEALRGELRAKRDLLCAGLTAAGLDPLLPAGTYFVNADVGVDAATFCATLPERCGVVAIPTSVFYDDAGAAPTLVRFAFCKRRDVISEAARRLAGLRGAG